MELFAFLCLVLYNLNLFTSQAKFGETTVKSFKECMQIDVFFYSDDAKPPLDRVSLTDEVKPLESDEDSMSGDYVDDADTSKFNEDGSFIGVYMGNKGQGQNQSMV